MRIAFLLNQFPALSETFILSQITGLIDRGHMVEIFADRPRADPIVHHDVTRYRLLDRTHYYSIYGRQPIERLRRVLHGARFAATRVWDRPLPILRALDPRRGREALSLRMLFRMMPFIDQPPFDIIQCHFGPNGVLGLKLRDIGVLRGRLVTMFHGNDATAYVRLVGRQFYADLFRRGDAFMHTTQYMADRLIKLGCDPTRLIRHPASVDTQRFNFIPRVPAPDGLARLLTVARLVEKKGLEFSIRAVAQVVRQHPHVRYTIVGDGPLRGALERLIADLGAGEWIRLAGWKEQEELRQIYAESHIFVLTSVTAASGDTEGQGVVLQEAQAMGLPVVCTRHNGFVEGVLEGLSALLVPERDVEGLAEAIGSLVARPERWPEMGQAGRRFVEERFDTEALNDRLVAIYQDMLHGSYEQYSGYGNTLRERNYPSV